MVKRTFDITISILALLMLSPLYLLIAILIKLDSRGPVFYPCTRVGRGGKIFKMYKFRTMTEKADAVSQSISPKYDVRVTDVGRFLRRFKLNELPQFYNVLRGDMSIVGPRPEDPKFVRYYRDQWEEILKIRPGILGPNQILGRNEDEMFPPDVDPEQFYVEKILPEKLPIDVDYARRCSFWTDVKYIFQGARAAFFGSVGMRHLRQSRTAIYLFLFDALLVVFSYQSAMLLRFEGSLPERYYWAFMFNIPVLILLRMAMFMRYRLYSVLIRYFTIWDIAAIVRGVAISSVLFVAFSLMFGERAHSRAVFLIDAVLVTFLLIGLRVAARYVREWEYDKSISILSRAHPDRPVRRVFIYGAGHGGIAALMQLGHSPDIQVVGFIDDNPEKRNKIINRVRILGSGRDLKALAVLHDVRDLYVAIARGDGDDLHRVQELCKSAGVRNVVIPAAGMMEEVL